MRAVVSALSLAALLSACDSSPRGIEKVLDARRAVSGTLPDSGTIEWRSETHGSFRGVTVICGEVDTGDGPSGMAGFQRFVSDGGTETYIESEMFEGDFARIWAEACG